MIDVTTLELTVIVLTFIALTMVNYGGGTSGNKLNTLGDPYNITQMKSLHSWSTWARRLFERAMREMIHQKRSYPPTTGTNPPRATATFKWVIPQGTEIQKARNQGATQNFILVNTVPRYGELVWRSATLSGMDSVGNLAHEVDMKANMQCSPSI